MLLPGPSRDGDADLGAEIAEQAGKVLLVVRDSVGFADGEALKNAGDAAAHEMIMSELAKARPDDAVLSEEGKGEQGRSGTDRLQAERVWIIDPLDGTREFSEAGRTDWAVHVALWERGADPDGRGGLTFGALAVPAMGLVLTSTNPPALPAPATPPRLVVSRTRPPAVAVEVAERLPADTVPMGSAGAKIAAVVLGEAELYVHAGGQYEWDSAAPVAVAAAAGLFTSRLSGSPLLYNQGDVSLPDLIVCRPDLADQILAVTRG